MGLLPRPWFGFRLCHCWGKKSTSRPNAQRDDPRNQGEEEIRQGTYLVIIWKLVFIEASSDNPSRPITVPSRLVEELGKGACNIAWGKVAGCLHWSDCPGRRWFLLGRWDFLLMFLRQVRHKGCVGQDARKFILACRFSCINHDLESAAGFLGAYDMSKAQDLTAVGIYKSTRQIIKNLCSPTGPAPHSVLWQLLHVKETCVTLITMSSFTQHDQPEEIKPLSFPGLIKGIEDHVEQYCTDAATDEMVGGELLQKAFPNLHVRSKDTTHATRRSWYNNCLFKWTEGLMWHAVLCQPAQCPTASTRIAARCTAADDFLAATMRDFVCGSQSPSSLIQNKQIFAVRFSQFVKEDKGWHCFLVAGDAKTIGWQHTWTKVRLNSFKNDPFNQGKNLRAAKHRFESLQKPTGRMETWSKAAIQFLGNPNLGCEVSYQMIHWNLAKTTESLVQGPAYDPNASHDGAHGQGTGWKSC